MPTTTHLSTDELLLRSDDELAAERVAHLEECAPCQAALADLISLLEVVAEDLRASLPAVYACSSLFASFCLGLRKNLSVGGTLLSLVAV